MFLKELKEFSKNNYWVYLLLTIALVIVYMTGKGNLIEIILLFMGTFLGNLFIMVMQKNYTAKKNKVGAMYHLFEVIAFTTVAIYGFVFLKQSQYLIWQIAYILAAAKAFTFYNYGKNISFLNHKTMCFINIILLSIYIFIYDKALGSSVEIFMFIGSLIMAIGFSFVTTGLVSIRDTFRYWTNLTGVIFIIVGAGIALVLGYINGSIDGLSLGYFILTFTVLIYYLKLLKKYLS